IMSDALIQRIKELEAELEKLRSQLKESRKDRPFDFSVHPRRHVALRLAYLGWAYQGFAVQENTDNTVEARLFEALLKTRLIQDRQSSNYHRCGRTDKGVSAFSQVITIDLRSTQFCGGLGVTLPENVDVCTKAAAAAAASELPYVKMLNRVLPQDIRVLDWAPVAEGFSARFDCQYRTYRYYFPRGSLDVGLMAEASKRYEGTHDFRNLCKMDVGNGLAFLYHQCHRTYSTSQKFGHTHPVSVFVVWISQWKVKVYCGKNMKRLNTIQSENKTAAADKASGSLYLRGEAP
uniref:Pseudouridylate synthase 3 n=1 Tax=Amphilophus citrinellus TaxID=61819 RepID=A0A3Q0T9U5_AMPCI